MGAAAIPLALTAVASGAQVYNQRQTAKRQDKQLAAQLRQQAAHQREADARTAEMLNRRAASTDAGDKSTALAQFTQAIQRAQGNAQRPLQSQGAVSDAYKRAGSDAALGMSQYAGNIADLVSSIDAPHQQRQREGWDTARFQGDLGQLQRRATGDDFLHRLRLQNIRPNPWIDAGAGLLGGYASAMGAGGGSAAPDPYQGWLMNDPRYAGPYG